MKTIQLIKKTVHFALTTLTFACIISGLGISEYRIMESVTKGLLTKNLSFRIHNDLIIPFIILLASHLYLTRKQL